ncbi:hypothetical protein GUJ93_ZPchr0003g18636 [Zizania palustris]|uniref:Uncharacterized protein n=1 Tax=Zizania palustris TaxID=103762 RepID=A0A8J5VX26_ZIZPA|nr:hypothetical protein GUJ93_ZPchr0003g18636 [Zizania palustris]
MVMMISGTDLEWVSGSDTVALRVEVERVSIVDSSALDHKKEAVEGLFGKEDGALPKDGCGWRIRHLAAPRAH